MHIAAATQQCCFSSAATARRRKRTGKARTRGRRLDCRIHPRTPIRGRAAPLRVCRAAEWRRWRRWLLGRILCGPTRIRVRALCFPDPGPATVQADPPPAPSAPTSTVTPAPALAVLRPKPRRRRVARIGSDRLCLAVENIRLKDTVVVTQPSLY